MGEGGRWGEGDTWKERKEEREGEERDKRRYLILSPLSLTHLPHTLSFSVAVPHSQSWYCKFF